MNEHLNTIISSAAIYLFIILSLRVFGKKDMAQLSLTDFVFILLISNAVQNAMVGENTSLLGGILAATTLLVINKIFKLILYKSDKVAKIMEGEPVVLIRHGKINEKELKRQKMPMRELEEACRENGEGDIKSIDLALLEVDGKISILKDEKVPKDSMYLKEEEYEKKRQE